MSVKSVPIESVFRSFVKLVKPIEGVRFVAVAEPGPPEIFTYIEGPDDAVMDEVFHSEYKIWDMYPDMPVKFHVVFLGGREFSAFMNPKPSLFFSREPLG